jgi:hypothetical protein
MAARTDVRLTRGERDLLDQLAESRGHASLATALGLCRDSLRRAMAGEAILRVTACALRHGLEELSDGPRHAQVDGGRA